MFCKIDDCDIQTWTILPSKNMWPNSWNRLNIDMKSSRMDVADHDWVLQCSAQFVWGPWSTTIWSCRAEVQMRCTSGGFIAQLQHGQHKIWLFNMWLIEVYSIVSIHYIYTHNYSVYTFMYTHICCSYTIQLCFCLQHVYSFAQPVTPHDSSFSADFRGCLVNFDTAG